MGVIREEQRGGGAVYSYNDMTYCSLHIRGSEVIE